LKALAISSSICLGPNSFGCVQVDFGILCKVEVGSQDVGEASNALEPEPAEDF
jgi:hypothetical protein